MHFWLPLEPALLTGHREPVKAAAFAQQPNCPRWGLEDAHTNITAASSPCIWAGTKHSQPWGWCKAWGLQGKLGDGAGYRERKEVGQVVYPAGQDHAKAHSI